MQPADKIEFQNPVVVGGLGGSGTRVVAEILKGLNFYLGEYTNEQLDNLWFTFLFRRPRTFRSFTDIENKAQVELFDSIMRGNELKRVSTTLKLYSIGAEFSMYNYVPGKERLSFPAGCIKSILNNQTGITGPWGWKEPNSHLFINSMATYYPGMKFIQVLRHPLDMVYGNNFLQLNNWHHLFDLPQPDKSNREELMLKYYDAANSRAVRMGKKLLGPNFLTIKFEDLCLQKSESIKTLLDFLELKISEQEKTNLTSIPIPPASLNRYKNFNWIELEAAEDICRRFGYAV